MAFVSMSFLELIHSLNIRSEKSIFKIGLFKNIYLIVAILIGMLMQVLVVIIPSIANIFGVAILNKEQWVYIMMISFLPIIIVELQKMLNEIKVKNKSFSCQIWKHNV